eukprot:GFYU01008851.1.p1 GENE.GFYU01008851.1~~GFYU01008851.1.p1  ORF type:complete len:324 (-),score=69.03 GFYU01008851.1:267-1238(-)
MSHTSIPPAMVNRMVWATPAPAPTPTPTPTHAPFAPMISYNTDMVMDSMDTEDSLSRKNKAPSYDDVINPHPVKRARVFRGQSQFELPPVQAVHATPMHMQEDDHTAHKRNSCIRDHTAKGAMFVHWQRWVEKELMEWSTSRTSNDGAPTDQQFWVFLNVSLKLCCALSRLIETLPIASTSDTQLPGAPMPLSEPQRETMFQTVASYCMQMSQIAASCGRNPPTHCINWGELKDLLSDDLWRAEIHRFSSAIGHLVNSIQCHYSHRSGALPSDTAMSAYSPTVATSVPQHSVPMPTAMSMDTREVQSFPFVGNGMPLGEFHVR